MATQKKGKKPKQDIVNKAGMLQASVKGTPVQLPDQFESKFITKDLISEIKETTEEIQTLLMSKSKIDIRIGEALATLKSQFNAYGNQKKISTKEVEQAFGEFVQEVFDIKESRANEYIRVTKRKELEGLKLTISNLVELSRLPGDALTEFLEEHPADELSEMSFRKMQTLVRENNENSRPQKVSSSSGGGAGSFATRVSSADAESTNAAENDDTPETPQASPIRELAVTVEDEPITGTVVVNPDIATAELRVSFESFKQAFESESLTAQATALLKEIHEWHTHLAKKAKGV
jgi:hypothetical protein